MPFFARDSYRWFGKIIAGHGMSRTRAEEAAIWQECYFEREGAAAAFRLFLEKDNYGRCRVTGHPGAGKTTFLKSRFQHPDRCCVTGLWMDIGQLPWNDVIRKAMEASQRDGCTLDERVIVEVRNELYLQMARRIYSLLVGHFWRIEKNPELEPLLYTDTTHLLSIRALEPSQEDRRQHHAEILRRVAAALIIDSTNLDNIQWRERAISGCAGWDLKKPYERIKYLSDRLAEGGLRLSSVLNYQSPDMQEHLALRWVLRYARMFPSPHMVCVFDNVDQVTGGYVHAGVASFAQRLAQQLRQDDKFPDDSQEDRERVRSIKVVLSLREANAPHDEERAEGDELETLHISLGEKELGYRDSARATHDPLTSESLYNILRDEVQLEKAQSDREGGSSKVHMDFLDQTVRMLWDPHAGISKDLPLVDLTNHSIRQTFSLVGEITEGVMANCGYDGEQLTRWMMQKRYYDLRGRVVAWVFSHQRSGGSLQKLISAEKTRVEQGFRRGGLPCCSHRLILTYLLNCSQYEHHRYQWVFSERPTFKEICKHLHKWARIPEDRTRATLLWLSNTHKEEADCVCIMAKGSDPASLEGALVTITPRGRALIVQIMVTLEYWTQLVGRISELSPDRVFFDLPPKGAALLALRIFKAVERLAQHHQANWASLVKECFAEYLGDRDSPFRLFQQAGLTYGDDFYLQRVATRHQQALRAFVSFYLRKKRGFPTEELAILSAEVLPPAESSRKKVWQDLEEAGDSGSVGEDRPHLMALLELSDRYAQLAGQLQSLKEKPCSFFKAAQ